MNEPRPTCKLNITACKYTNIGARPENEDSCECVVDGSRNMCAILADGLGGEGGGAKASQSAVLTVTECFRDHPAGDPEELADWFSRANEEVLRLQSPQCEMKTTLVVLQISDDRALWAHLGDSRLYHFEDGTIKMRTFDHSVSQMAVLRGEIREEEIRGHVDRNRLLKAIGRGEEVRAECSESLDLADGKEHAFLLCSDGFWENILENEMEEAYRDASDVREWLRNMVRIVRGRSKPNQDNNTAVAVMIK